jgi:cytochrome P450
MVPPETLTTTDQPLIGTYAASPAGPITEAELAGLKPVPEFNLPQFMQVLRFGQRQAEFVLSGRKQFGEVFRFHGIIPGHPVISGHPDHAKSLFTAKPELAPTLTTESPLRPIVGKDSVLTARGERHLRQRKLLLPSFHGDSIARYMSAIEHAIDDAIDQWPVGEEIELAPLMQDVTLDVIMSGIFGVEGRPQKGTPEYRLAKVTRRIADLSTTPMAKAMEYVNVGREEAVGVQKYALAQLDKPFYEVIAQRRKVDDLDERTDIMSMLMRARTEEGEALTDQELRDELITLVLAGHETTANQLAWTWERLTRTPDAYNTLYESVRANREDKADQVEYVLQESMRSRPVIPMVGRRVQVPWQLGECGVRAQTPVSISIFLVHHREDLYPEPWEFKPQRWIDQKPGTYEWIPFGGGTRRCLGASLAMAEMRVVLERMAARLEIEPDRPEAEHVQHRNVTMIPKRGARVVLREKI